MFTREIKDVFDELGINSARPIREQKPNPLPDRKALDDIVFRHPWHDRKRAERSLLGCLRAGQEPP